MPGNIGLPEIIIVLVIVLIIFGPKRLPELARSVGKASREFKHAINHDEPKDTTATEIKSGDDAEPAVTATPVGDADQKSSTGS